MLSVEAAWPPHPVGCRIMAVYGYLLFFFVVSRVFGAWAHKNLGKPLNTIKPRVSKLLGIPSNSSYGLLLCFSMLC